MYKDKVVKLLALAGITLNGSSPYDIQVKDERFYQKIIGGGSVGVGESYMNGWWDVQRLDQLTYKIIRAKLISRISRDWRFFLTATLARIINRQSRGSASKAVKNHYDIGNDLFKKMLGKHTVYTCAYWNKAKSLDEAQEAKMDLVCQKLSLKTGQRILDIGCGWGSFAKFAAEKYGVEVVGITISEEQMSFAQELCKGLPVTIKLQDYRDLEGEFDHVVSIGMFEAVGHKDFKIFMESVARCLKDGGLFLLHTIGGNESVTAADPWISKYIFQSGMLPSIAQIGRSIENVFVMEDWHNFGTDYEKTLLSWHKNFNDNWKDLKDKYGERFKRMWDFYLLTCAGAFRARDMQLWQIVLSKNMMGGGYNSVR